jgi:hypothetical protein
MDPGSDFDGQQLARAAEQRNRNEKPFRITRNEVF